MKKFQDSNWIVKLFRYRWYLLVPILWLWYSTIRKFKVGIDEIEDGDWKHTDKYESAKGKLLWGILIGEAQFHMNWTYTKEDLDEYFEKLKMTKNEND